MKVELGAGANPAAGYTPVDVNPRHAHVVADALHLPFRDRSVTAMRAVDVLEHLSYRDTHTALTEWARVLAPDAALYVQVPDAETIMRWFAGNDPRVQCADIGPCSALYGATWRLLGGHADGRYDDHGDWKWNAHYAFFSEQTLREHLAAAGLTVDRLEHNQHPNLCVWAHRP